MADMPANKMPVNGRVSSLSSCRTSPEMKNMFPQDEGKLKFEPTPSRKNIKIDPDQVVFRTSSLALLQAKGRGKSSTPGEYSGNSKGNRFVHSPTTTSETGSSTTATSSSAEESQLSYKSDPRKDDPQAYLEGARRIVDFMYNLWRNNRLCDVVLHTKSQDLYAHKVALGAYSEALAEKFSEFPTGEVMSIDLYDVKDVTVRIILTFVYTTDIHITDHNIAEVIYCATELGIELIVALCIEYLLARLNANNAITFFCIAEDQGLENPKHRIMSFIIDNFSDVIKSKSFLKIPFDRLIQWLSGDHLAVGSELEIFYAIVIWVDHDRKERLKLAPMLLRCVRYQLLDLHTIITKMEVVDWIFRPRDCHDWLYDVIRYQALKCSGDSLVNSYQKQQPRVFKRKAFSRNSPSPTSSALGPQPTQQGPTLHYLRLDGSPTAKGRAYQGNATFPEATQSPQANSAVQTTAAITSPVIKTSTEFSPVVHSRSEDSSHMHVYAVAVGGIDLQSIDPDVPGRFIYRYNAQNNTWSVMATLRDYTHHHGAASINSKLYIIGGAIYDHTQPQQLGRATNAVHVYDPRMRSWTAVQAMKERRAYHSVATWGSKIYVVGGENEDKVKLDSIECYDVATSTWRYVARMMGGAKIGVGVAVLGDLLYIVGGYNKDRPGSHVLADVECFNMAQERWMRKKPIAVPRCHASLVEAKGRLFLIGGRTKTNEDEPRLVSLGSVEMYDAVNDTWQHVTELYHPRHDAGCVAIGSRVYIVGGVQTPNPFCLSTVECFNAETGTKMAGVMSIPSAAAGMACCALLA